VKPLQSIWSIYPQYNCTNTVICDDRKFNFILNPNNGILVTPYSYENRTLDRELEDLRFYLRTIINYDDFSKNSHEDWKELLK
ncbi:hypothetical protein ILUMI_22592, partial [Ignelater luminosus]